MGVIPFHSLHASSLSFVESPKSLLVATSERLHGPVGAVVLLTRPTWAILFHPPDPPIASQSLTRDAPFSQAPMARRTV